MARALVIGGTQLIGRALVEQLLARGDTVVLMHRGTTTPFGDRVTAIRCDRNDTAAVQSALAGERFDVVYDNVYDWQRGTTPEQVVAAARATASGLSRYVFTSSVAVYSTGGPFTEDSPLVPEDHPDVYGAQKANSERALFALGPSDGLPVSTLRPAFIYGPHNAFDREAFFWDRLRDGRPIIIPDDGQATMQWVSAHDVARAAILAATHEAAIGQAYNLGNDPPITQLDFVHLLARAAGTEAQVVHVPRARIQQLGGSLMQPPNYFGVYLDIPAITANAAQVTEHLGLTLTPLEHGMRETYAWYAQQPRVARDYAWEDALLRANAT
ncbi:NAD-dependent epimerase/dehydratase family protein [Gemmatimonas groenlandica]|uniref:NAD-dependent epimerase/dehydratase family protein n=1 Tax=Gemmatimonas groenlandica TaxID=2732249 RepID=A0A6M4IRC4_9BACT|nr:NAD-dependent epimerase/dehydratase family protein [Gemmatimonas groenlandica]QJR37260.1 NAD-dependent epimerase/dehydratase family protein [Gemmatimonas groenlandica]